MSATTTPPRLLRLPEVIAQTGMARTTLYDFIRAGTFPRPVPLTSTARAWVAAEVERWIADRIAERDAQGGAP